jgi:hypothetical protein
MTRESIEEKGRRYLVWGRLGKLDESLARSAALLCRQAGADP